MIYLSLFAVILAFIVVSGCITVSFPTQTVKEPVTQVLPLTPVETVLPVVLLNQTDEYSPQIPLIQRSYPRNPQYSQLELPIQTFRNFPHPGEKIESGIQEFRDSVIEWREDRVDRRENIIGAVLERRESIREGKFR